jgi:hypothetical protein
MRTVHWLLVLLLAVVITGVVSQRMTAQRLTPPPPVVRPIGAIRDIMKGIVEPSSNVIFGSAGYTVSAAGFKDLRPANDEAWDNVSHNALMLAEAANLLKMTGRAVARPEDRAPSTSDEAPELTPSQIQEKIERDRGMWNTFADALQERGVEALKAARAHDAEGLLSVGDAIDTACENCHLEYWYPNEKEENKSD